MDTNMFYWIVITLITLNTSLIFLILKAVIVMLEDIRDSNERIVLWLREIAGNSLDESEEDI